jgi:hypothetical protein
MRPVLYTILVALLSGCAGYSKVEPISQTTVGGFDVLTRSPERHLVMFQTPDDIERFCMSPTPDAVGTSSEGVKLGGIVPTGSEESVGEDASRGALSLGGRAPSVLITRELMYRACELSMNIKADPELTLQIYRETVKALTEIIASQHGEGAKALAAQANDPRFQEIDMKLFCKRYPDNDLCSSDSD